MEGLSRALADGMAESPCDRLLLVREELFDTTGTAYVRWEASKDVACTTPFSIAITATNGGGGRLKGGGPGRRAYRLPRTADGVRDPVWIDLHTMPI